MATEGRRPRAALIDALRGDPSRFDFFQAVRVLEAAARSRPAPPSDGHDDEDGAESVRFRSVPSLAFPPAPIRAVKEDESGATSVHVNFLGLIGPAGVLPQHYTELVTHRLHEKDEALRDFLDVLHDRAVRLFHRAWTKYAFPFAFERERADAAGDDDITRAVLALVGLDSPNLQGRLAVDDLAQAHFAGHLARTCRSEAGLRSMLTDFFGFPVEVESFVGHWLEVPADGRTRLGGPGVGQHNALGVDAVLGGRVWDVQSRARLVARPRSYDQYRRLMPGHAGRARLADLLRIYAGLDVGFELVVELPAGETPLLRITSRGEDRSRLGHDSWVQAGRASGARRARFALDRSTA